MLSVRVCYFCGLLWSRQTKTRQISTSTCMSVPQQPLKSWHKNHTKQPCAPHCFVWIPRIQFRSKHWEEGCNVEHTQCSSCLPTVWIAGIEFTTFYKVRKKQTDINSMHSFSTWLNGEKADTDYVVEDTTCSCSPHVNGDVVFLIT